MTGNINFCNVSFVLRTLNIGYNKKIRDKHNLTYSHIIITGDIKFLHVSNVFIVNLTCYL